MSERMEQNVDSAAWATFATTFGLIAAPHWLAQFAMSIFTLVVSLIVAHFAQRELNRRWPKKRPDNQKE